MGCAGGGFGLGLTRDGAGSDSGAPSNGELIDDNMTDFELIDDNLTDFLLIED